jgi:hypothetical protein
LDPEGGKTRVVAPTLADFDEERIWFVHHVDDRTPKSFTLKSTLGAHRKLIQAADFPRFSVENAAPCRKTWHFKSETN